MLIKDKKKIEKKNLQLSEKYTQRLEKQAYRIAGSHSAVKVCSWTKNMIRGLGGCYKLKFYGIMSHQCMQMTTSMSCANRCVFCWRGYKAPVSKEWEWKVDEPNIILEESEEEHHKLLVGFKGNKEADKKTFKASNNVKHVALSLTGEPIIYPKINELIRLFHKKNISTFLVTNAQYPEQIKDLDKITQLYLSLDAPTKELLKKIDSPLFEDYWERLNKSLEYFAERKDRTCIRLTIIKGLNDNHLKEYASLINKGNPDFIEIKAYMFVGESRNRLKKENMPLHEEIVLFSKELVKHLSNYRTVSEHIPSRVVMLAKNEFKINNSWQTWINFKKFHELTSKEKDFSTKDYLLSTPQTGLSGKGTRDLIREREEIELE
ncbi:4-demethylwyosine synthase TYW1 [Candidatus Woesearchaeota archaeon]|jgi:tRNA wybutosine-synthesizing protein 1|nr:4-demethylwyosine synthase TYW1 [Candidatus Woesearchaeota archaeon]